MAGDKASSWEAFGFWYLHFKCVKVLYHSV
jgi:hypothetical protein